MTKRIEEDNIGLKIEDFERPIKARDVLKMDFEPLKWTYMLLEYIR